MSKPLFNDKNEALMEIKKCLNSIELIEQSFHHSGAIVNPVVVHAIGRSLMQLVYTICEAVLYLICSVRVERMDPKEWPKIREVDNHCKQHNYIDCPPDYYEAAGRMAKLKKSCDRKATVTPQDLERFFNETAIFVEWLKHAARGSLDETFTYEDIDCIVATDFLIDFIREWKECYEREYKYAEELWNDSQDYWNNSEDYRLSLLDTSGIDLDSMSEEEISKLYKPRKGNQRKSLYPLFIYLILQKYSKDKRLHTSDILYHLKEDYEITDVGRNTVERILHTLEADGDINIYRRPEKGSGYWYSERNEEEPEDDYDYVELDF